MGAVVALMKYLNVSEVNLNFECGGCGENSEHQTERVGWEVLTGLARRFGPYLMDLLCFERFNVSVVWTIYLVGKGKEKEVISRSKILLILLDPL